jgi:hypothetical protein
LLPLPDTLRYALLGHGRWASRLNDIILSEGRAVTSVDDLRQHAGEATSAYILRLTKSLRSGGAQIAWISTLPGPHVSHMIEAAVLAGLDAIVEKPWYGSRSETLRLRDLALAHNRIVAFHYEYCVLTELENWRREFHPGTGLRFGGRFYLSRSDHTGIPAIENLGCHLLSLREFAVPQAAISSLECSYERPDERRAWIEDPGKRIASVDLFTHGQPIIQRFMKKVEAARGGAAFPFDLAFALRIAEELALFSGRALL